VRRKRHRNGLTSEFVRAPDDGLKNFAVSQVKAIEVADADHGWVGDICIRE
jgi:hypothetical protein